MKMLCFLADKLSNNAKHFSTIAIVSYDSFSSKFNLASQVHAVGLWN